MTHYEKVTREEIARRNYTEGTTRAYLRALHDLAGYFQQPPERLTPAQILEYTAHPLEDREVVFRRRDSAHHNKKRLMQLTLDEFLQRFFLYVLPRGFVRIRHFGFLAHRRRAKLLPVCFALLSATAESQPLIGTPEADIARPLWTCPQCGGPMAIVERFTAAQARLRAPPPPRQAQ